MEKSLAPFPQPFYVWFQACNSVFSSRSPVDYKDIILMRKVLSDVEKKNSVILHDAPLWEKILLPVSYFRFTKLL